jgi:hypothetical protein
LGTSRHADRRPSPDAYRSGTVDAHASNA